MATPAEKLATSLEALQTLQDQGIVAIRSIQLSRTHRERLVKNGFLRDVMKGWYIPSHPDEATGESTAWYASFWDFCAGYLEDRFSDKWCLSPEQSLSIHAENWNVPPQLLARAEQGDNKPITLPHNTSIFVIRANLPAPDQSTTNHGLRIFSLASALIAANPDTYIRHPTDIRIALAMIQDASEVLGLLLEGGHTKIAGRLAGAFRNIGNDKIADQIVKTMRTADYKVQEEDPFEAAPAYQPPPRERSPCVNRLCLMWQEMRDYIVESFPKPPGIPADKALYLKHIDDVYVTDAYHSLSIEGYRVNRELIERVRAGAWNADDDPEDKQRLDALAARGYWQAFQSVKETVDRILDGEDPGSAVDKDHGDWHQQLFGPSVTAGILKPADLAGYRNSQVYIRNSLHTPLRVQAVRESMPVFFDLLVEEPDPAVRVVLGHFIFVYIHPYMDGNGRIGRFLMNAMMAGGGYPWTIIPVERRDEYMQAIEQASVYQNIAPFTDFLVGLVQENIP